MVYSQKPVASSQWPAASKSRWSLDGIERPSVAKASIENVAVIAAVNRCATRKLEQSCARQRQEQRSTAGEQDRVLRRLARES